MADKKDSDLHSKKSLEEIIEQIETLSSGEIADITDYSINKARIMSLNIKNRNKFFDKDFLNYLNTEYQHNSNTDEILPLLDSKSNITREKQSETIKTKSNSLNRLLGGGFSPGNSYLFFGEFATGKSQLAHQLCIDIFGHFSALDDNFRIMYFDAENTFRPERLEEIVRFSYFEQNIEEILKRINISKPINSLELLNQLGALNQKIKDWNVKAIIIDSLSFFSRPDFRSLKRTGRDEKKIFVEILKKLDEIKTSHAVLVFCTSQIKDVGKDTKGLFYKPILDIIVNGFFDYMVMLSKSYEGDRFAYLVNCEMLPEEIVEFQLDKNGIIDVQ